MTWRASIRRVFFLLLSAYVLAGCAPQLSVGEPCALPSDCPAPLTCLLDRCRSECAANRDCDDGATCLLDEVSGARACRTVQELTCAGGDDCGPLACVRGRCTQRCTETSDCGGTVCANEEDERVCVEPTGGECAVSDDCAFGICRDGRCDEIRSLDAGDGATCLLLESGRLACAGFNSASVLSGAMVRFVPEFAPVLDVSGTQPPFESVQVGTIHACAVADGRMRCWGGGDRGQTGSSTITAPIPSPLSALSGVREISAASWSSCARTDDAVFCLGWDQFGQLGDSASHGEPTAFSTTPVRVELPAGVIPVQLHTSGFHACIVDAMGAVYCWGGNDYAQIRPEASTLCRLETTDYGCEPTPVRIPGFGPGEARAVQVTTGQSHTCVLDDVGAVRCFGRNQVGQLGVSPLGDVIATPVMPFAGGVRAIDAGQYHTCALLTDGRLSCWGSNGAGQLGTGGGGFTVAPTDVDGLSDIVAFTCGHEHGCALRDDGALFCWGGASGGRLGDDPSGPEVRGVVPVPVRVYAGESSR